MSLTAIFSAALAAVVWHWWIAPLLLGGGVVVLIATIVGYLAQVTRPQFPPKGYQPPALPSDTQSDEAAAALPEATDSALATDSAPSALPEGATSEASN